MNGRRTRSFVRSRAGGRCEYCGLPESAFELAFHVEHVVAKQHGGDDERENIALACDRCNLFKGPNLSAIDPVTQAVVRLFHPRRDLWDAHFFRDGILIQGKTPTGRATVNLLRMNAPSRLQVREQLKSDASNP